MSKLVHCRVTRSCLDVEHCVCHCAACAETICSRPGCSPQTGCAKIHVGSERWRKLMLGSKL